MSEDSGSGTSPGDTSSGRPSESGSWPSPSPSPRGLPGVIVALTAPLAIGSIGYAWLRTEKLASAPWWAPPLAIILCAVPTSVREARKALVEIVVRLKGGGK